MHLDLIRKTDLLIPKRIPATHLAIDFSRLKPSVDSDEKSENTVIFSEK